MNGRIGLTVITGLLLVSGAALGQGTGRPYDGIDAGLDAYNRAEEQRQFAVGQQRALNEDLRARSYLPPGPVVFYGPSAGYGYSGSSYSYSTRGPLGYRRVEERVVARPIVSAVVWPNRYYGLNTYTYPFKAPLRQPIGQQQTQTGPNRWESHPVYAEPPPRFPVTPPIANDPLETRGPPGVRPSREF